MRNRKRAPSFPGMRTSRSMGTRSCRTAWASCASCIVGEPCDEIRDRPATIAFSQPQQLGHGRGESPDAQLGVKKEHGDFGAVEKVSEIAVEPRQCLVARVQLGIDRLQLLVDRLQLLLGRLQLLVGGLQFLVDRLKLLVG